MILCNIINIFFVVEVLRMASDDDDEFVMMVDRHCCCMIDSLDDFEIVDGDGFF